MNALSVKGLAVAAALAAVSASAQPTATRDASRGTVLDVPAAGQSSAPVALPRRAITKAAVRRQYGPPERRFAPVGDPPITRWDYPGFRVFFEYDRVLHSVVPGDFPAISHSDQLTAP